MLSVTGAARVSSIVSCRTAMFDFFKPNKSARAESSHEECQAEFQRRCRALYEKFAIEDTPYDLLLDAMAAVENEMNRNGGCNWNSGDYDEFLDVLREHLCADEQFSQQQVSRINWALGEIATCGDELERDGESGRAIEEPIDYLIERGVDWCRTHEPKNPEDS